MDVQRVGDTEPSIVDQCHTFAGRRGHGFVKFTLAHEFSPGLLIGSKKGAAQHNAGRSP